MSVFVCLLIALAVCIVGVVGLIAFLVSLRLRA